MENPINSIRRSIKTVGLFPYMFYGLLTVITLGPMIWILLISLKTSEEYMANPFGFPQAIQFNNYIMILTNSDMVIYLKNSVIVSTTCVILLLGTSILTAYALARIEFRIANLLFIVFVMGDMIPMISFIVPLYVINQYLGISTSRWALILPYVAAQSGFAVYVLRGFFRSIPSDIEDSARIDGCNTLQLIWSIMLPMIRGGVIVVGIISFIIFWNEYYVATILLSTTSQFTLPAGLAVSFFGQFVTNWPAAAAGSIFSILPVAIIFILLQDRIIKGWARV